MAITVGRGRTLLNNTTGTQDLTITGLGAAGDMKAAVFWWSWAQTDATAAAGGLLGFSFTDGTTSRSYAIHGRDARDPTQCRTVGDNQLVSIYTVLTGAYRVDASWSAWITDGVRISIDVASSSNNWFVEYAIFADDGSDLSVKVAEFTTNTDDTLKDITTIGFEYDMAFFLSGMRGITAGSPGNFSGTQYTDSHCISFGVSHNDGSATPPQYAIGWYDRDDVSGTEVAQRVATDCAINHIDHTASREKLEISGLDSSGFDVTNIGTTGAAINVAVLALKFNSAVDFWTGVVDSPGSATPGSTNHNDFGFELQAAMMLHTRCNAVDTLKTVGQAAMFGVSAWDGTNSGSMCVTFEDNVNPSNVVSYSESTGIKTYQEDGTTTDHAATFTSFPTSGGVTLNYATGDTTVRKWLAWGISPFKELRIDDDTESIVEGIVRLMASARVQGDTESIAETVVRVRGLMKTLDDTESIAEVLVYLLESARVIDDTEEVQETLVRVLGLTLAVDETETVVEAIVALMGKALVSDDTETVAESIVAVLEMVAPMSAMGSRTAARTNYAFTGAVVNRVRAVARANYAVTAALVNRVRMGARTNYAVTAARSDG